MTKRTILAPATVTLASLLLAGCATFAPPPKKEKPAQPISTPQDESSPGENRMSPTRYANSQPQADEKDPQLAKLNEKIQQFAARFPTTDLDRNAAGGQKDQAATTPGAASPSTQPAQFIRAMPVAPKPPAVAATQPAVAVTAAIPAPSPKPAGIDQASPTAVAAAQPATQPAVETEVVTDMIVPNRPANMEAAASPKPRKIEAPTPAALASALRIEIMDIRPAAAPPATLENTQPSANRPTPSPNAGAKTADISSVISSLEEAVRQNPQHLDDQLRLRMLYLATGQAEKATAPVKDVDPMQGEILAALFKAVAATQDAMKDPTTGAASALAATGELSRLVGEQSPVVIPKIALVTRVDNFGNYQAISPPAFASGRQVYAYLYAEVANFRSQPTPDGRLRTVLSAKLEVFEAGGRVVWQRAFPQIEDRAFSARRDFFVPLEVKLPLETPPGEYVVKVTIEDKLGATTDQQRMSFTIGNQ